MSHPPRCIAVTGTSEGLGRAVASALMEDGAVVFGCSRKGSSPPGVRHARVDVRKSADVDAWASEIAKETRYLNALINNAGSFGIRSTTLQIAPTTWRRVLATNVEGPVNACRALLPLLKCATAPLIINVGSVVGHTPRAGMGPYCVSKAALNSLSAVLAQELAPEGVAVTTLIPSRASTSLRRDGYPKEPQLPTTGVTNLVNATRALIARRENVVSGLVLHCDDLEFWRGY